MYPSTLAEILDASHQTAYIKDEYEPRGGIMIIAPPENMKSTLIIDAFRPYPDALVLSDINVKTLINLRDDLISGRYNTIAFSAYEKLYMRHQQTSSNIEATLMAIAEEGFTRASFEDQRIPMMPARALVVGGTYPALVAQKYKQWADSGFLRRFLWINYAIKNPEQLSHSVRKGKKIKLGSVGVRSRPIGHYIEHTITDSESEYLQQILQDQRGKSTPFVLMKRIVSVLKWKYEEEPERVWEIINDFKPALSEHGVRMLLPEQSCNGLAKEENLKSKEAKFEL